MSKTLATLILAAQAFREASWQSANEPAGRYAHYRVSLEKAATAVCQGNEALAPLVIMLLVNSWNESADWAKQYLTEHPDGLPEQDAFYHLRAVSGSRNSFDWSSLPVVDGIPQLPRRSREVEDMHTAAVRYICNREAELEQLASVSAECKAAAAAAQSSLNALDDEDGFFTGVGE